MKKGYQGIIAFASMFMLATAAFGQYAVTNATIITVSRGTITNGTIVIEGDRIAAFGTDIVLPKGIEVIDATDLYVYPGMIGTNTNLGLTELGGVTQTQDQLEVGTYNTFIRASQGVNPHTILKGIARWNGVTSAITVPRTEKQGVFAGHEVLLDLNGWSVDEMTVQDPVAMQMTFPDFNRNSGGNNGEDLPRQLEARGGRKNRRNRAEKVLSDVKKLFEKTRRYSQAQADFEARIRSSYPVTDLTLEGLKPVVRKEVPLTITVNGVENIRKAITFVKETGIRAVFAGAQDAYKIAEEIAEAEIPVLYSGLLTKADQYNPYDLHLTVPSVLHKAGVTIAMSIANASDLQNLPFMAGMAAAYGLPKDVALKTVTLYPAEIYGVDDKLGSIEVGKMANIVIADGDLLEPRTKVIHEFIRGQKVDLSDNYQFQLYEKHRKRPAKK